MKTFEVHFKGFTTIQAKSLREANEKMEKEHPDLETTDFYDCEQSKSNEVIGHCEVSGLSIFEGDEYLYDEDGVMWLKEFEDKCETCRHFLNNECSRYMTNLDGKKCNSENNYPLWKAKNY